MATQLVLGMGGQLGEQPLCRRECVGAVAGTGPRRLDRGDGEVERRVDLPVPTLTVLADPRQLEVTCPQVASRQGQCSSGQGGLRP